MEILLSHSNLDFDGLASLVAAKKLFPSSHIVLTGKVGKSLQEFLALHKDAIQYKLPQQIELGEVDSAVLVDIAGAGRLGPFKQLLQEKPEKVRAVFDHHPSTEGDFLSGEGCIEIVGAATTLLVEEIKRQAIEINAFEATVLALGIYEDTGSLTFSSTTARDVYAAGFLLEKGANLTVVADFLDNPISSEQRHLLNLLLTNQQIYHIHGFKVLLAVCSISDYIGGLNVVTHRMLELSSADLLFSIVMMEDRIHLVARSRVDAADVGEIAEHFGGGGHQKAASAVIRSQDVNAVADKLINLLQQVITPAISAFEIMSTPVKSLSPEVSVEEAGKIMLRYGHSGLPVVKIDRLVGIISRRDLDKAQHHGLGHAPVKAFMSSKVITIDPDTPLAVIQDLMTQHDIGRLPVVKDDKLVGIVSRTDVLKTLHGDNLPSSFKVNFLQACPCYENNNLAQLMKDRLPAKLYGMVQHIGKLADQHLFNVYMVGGLVRDLLLGLPNYDLDLVVEGDGLAFAKLLADSLGAKVRSHEKFATAVILLENGEKIDVATARTEFYEFPAALPTVESSSLKQDLYRRDFTINAMAVNINSSKFGQLIDYFNGKEDLDGKLVRVLYNLSFVEDPTRIIRAIRFEQRYGFEIEEQTLAFAKHAIDNNLLEKLSYQRIREEIDLILNEQNPLFALQRMKHLEIWQHIMPELLSNDKVWKLLASVQIYLTEGKLAQHINKKHIYLCTIFAYIDEQVAQQVLARFHWTKKERDAVQEFLTLRKKIKLLKEEASNEDFYSIHLALSDNRLEVIIVCAFLLAKKKRVILLKYCDLRKKTISSINGKDLTALGVQPGPLYRQLLIRVFAAKLAGKVTNKIEELQFVKNLLEMENMNG